MLDSPFMRQISQWILSILYSHGNGGEILHKFSERLFLNLENIRDNVWVLGRTTER